MTTEYLLKKRVRQTTLGAAALLSCLLPLVACGTDDSENQDWWADSGSDAKAGSGGSGGQAGTGGSSYAGSGGSGGSGGSATGGSAGSMGGSAGSTGGSAGNTGGSAGNTGGSAGSTGGAAGSTGGAAGSTGGAAGSTGGAAGSTGGAAGSTGGSAGSTGGSAGSTGGSAGSTGGSGGSAGGTASDDLTGYWLWEDRVAGNTSLGFAHLNGQARMRMAFGANNTCHYIWNETTGSDFHTPCTYTISGDMVTYTATADPDGTAFGYSCTHPDWESWNDRPAVEYGMYKFVGDRLWLGVNAYWGFGGGALGIPTNGSCKRFGYWESLGQADYGGPNGTLDTWIVYKRVTKQEWENAGAGSCAACATYPAAAVCQ